MALRTVLGLVSAKAMTLEPERLRISVAPSEVEAPSQGPCVKVLWFLCEEELLAFYECGLLCHTSCYL